MQAASDVELLEDGGITYELTRSRKPSANNGGYEGVVKQGNLFHAKLTLARGGGQTVLPGDGLNTPQEAALRIAKYKLAPYEIEKKNPYRAAKGEGKVRRLNMGHALLLTPVCCASGMQKRKHSEEGEDEFDGYNCRYPTWVVCMDSLILFNRGVPPPPELRLSKGAAREVKRIRAWAAKTAELPMARQMDEADANAPQPPPPPPQTVHVQALRSPLQQAPSQFDPETLRKAAALQKGPRVGL